jgi:hypothetical protein
LEVDKLHLIRGRQIPNDLTVWHLSSWLKGRAHFPHLRWLPLSIDRHFFQLDGQIKFGLFKWFEREASSDNRSGVRYTGYTLYVLQKAEYGFYGDGDRLGPTIRVSDKQAQAIGESLKAAYVLPSNRTVRRDTYVCLGTRHEHVRLNVDIVPKFAANTHLLPIKSSDFYAHAAQLQHGKRTRGRRSMV